VTYTATVTGEYGGAVTGTVSFQDGRENTIVPLCGGIATLAESYTTRGPHRMTAVYSGDTNDTGSSSGTLTEYVETLPVTSKTVVTSSGSTSFVGQAVTFTASVSSTYGAVPNGESVTFYNGTSEIGTGTTNNGVALLTTSALSAQTHTIKAIYSGDGTFKTSSGTLKQVILKYTTTTSLNSSPNPSNDRQSVTLIAQVTTTGSSTPAGTVTFKSGTTTLGTKSLDGTGIATLSTTKLPVGSDSLTASYNGDAFNGKGTSSPLTETVN
jgi:hypothetical protein